MKFDNNKRELFTLEGIVSDKYIPVYSYMDEIIGHRKVHHILVADSGSVILFFGPDFCPTVKLLCAYENLPNEIPRWSKDIDGEIKTEKSVDARMGEE